MTVNYHISKNGQRNFCYARPGNCRLQGGHATRAELVYEQQVANPEDRGMTAVADQLSTWDEVHYRLYLRPGTNEPKAVCVQNFDYYDYDEARFLDKVAYKTEADAQYAAEEFNEEGAPACLRTKRSRAEIVMREQRNKTTSEAFDEVYQQINSHDEVHYRVYLSPRTNEPKPICVQSFDYHDYEGSRFLDKVAYKTEADAQYAAEEFNEEGKPAYLKKTYSKAEQIMREQRNKGGHEAFLDVMSQLNDWDEVHYRTYLSKRAGEPTTVCVQSFDYTDYDGSRFLDAQAYATEEEAEAALEAFAD